MALLQRSLYATRRRRNIIAVALAVAATAFGLAWLVLILAELLWKGFSGLNLAVFTGNTVQLQAAAAAMTPGMTQLKALQAKISALGDGLKEAASILSGIDTALTELGKLV